MVERAWAYLRTRFSRADAARLVSSLILATMLWSYVSLITDPEETQTFSNIQIAPPDDLGDNLITTSDLPAVSVRLTGPESVLDDIAPSDIELSIDTDEIDGPSDGQELRVRIDTPDGVRRSVADPAFVTVNVAERATPREVALTPRLVQEPNSAALQVGIPEPAVSVVTISGAAPVVRRVESVVLPIDIGSHVQTFQETFTPIALDAEGFQIPEVDIQPQRVLTTVPIEQRGRTAAVLVDIVGQPASGYQVNDRRTIPQSVVLDGSPELLNSIVYVYTEPVDISGAMQDVSTAVPIDVSRLPEGVSVLSPLNGEVQVIVQVSMVGSPQTLPGQSVQINGLESGYAASIDPPQVGVIIEASNQQVEALQPGDIDVSVDATGMAPGTYQLRPAVSVPPEMSWIRTDPEYVSVTITEADAFNGNDVPGLGGDGEATIPPTTPPASPITSPEA